MKQEKLFIAAVGSSLDGILFTRAFRSYFQASADVDDLINSYVNEGYSILTREQDGVGINHMNATRYIEMEKNKKDSIHIGLYEVVVD